MPEKSLADLPDVFISNSEIKLLVARGIRQGKIRKLASRLYTKNLTGPPEQIIKRNLWQIVGGYVPGALIADRTAIENAPAQDGSIFVITDRKRDIALPGVTIRVRKGTGPLENDRPFIGGLYLSSQARAYLENMMPTRRRGRVARTLTRKEVEARLEAMLRRGGAEALNNLRDEARTIAPQLEQQDSFAALDRLIGALLGTQDEKLVTPQGQARYAGTPFDPDRLRLFELLHKELRNWPPVTRKAPARTPEATDTLAFFEAYFSNFIEGTEFEVKEAAAIVFDGVIPRERPADAHDVLGTWRIVSDKTEISKTPKTAAELVQHLRMRHAIIMSARPDKRPGEFKIEGNRAGSTVFVAPDLVQGTLERGFEFFQSLETPFARAVFMMFLISEVHPFADGNGRLARIMMNAELVAGGDERIIIPTIYRGNYLSALKALSQVQNPEPVIRALDYAQRWVLAMPWGVLAATTNALEGCNAFMDSSEAENTGKRLKIPNG